MTKSCRSWPLFTSWGQDMKLSFSQRDPEDTDSSAAPSALEHGVYIPLDYRTFLQWTFR
jgi:hypothetical protein